VTLCILVGNVVSQTNIIFANFKTKEMAKFLPNSASDRHTSQAVSQ